MDAFWSSESAGSEAGAASSSERVGVVTLASMCDEFAGFGIGFADGRRHTLSTGLGCGGGGALDDAAFSWLGLDSAKKDVALKSNVQVQNSL